VGLRAFSHYLCGLNVAFILISFVSEGYAGAHCFILEDVPVRSEGFNVALWGLLLFVHVEGCIRPSWGFYMSALRELYRKVC
jgi:hypothetical protein